jgi:hypothetical protein
MENLSKNDEKFLRNFTNEELNTLIKYKEALLPKYSGSMLIAELQSNIRDLKNEQNSRKPKGWWPFRKGGKTCRRRSRSRRTRRR